MLHHVYIKLLLISLGAGHLDERILELAISLSHQGYSPDKITWFMNLLSSLKVEESKPTKQEDLLMGKIPDIHSKFVPGIIKGEI